MGEKKWTFEKAMARIGRGGYQGLSYWSAWDYINHYHREKFLAAMAAVV